MSNQTVDSSTPLLSCTLHVNVVWLVFFSLALPVSSAVWLLDSPSSPVASSSFTKLEGNRPDLPLKLPFHQPSSTCTPNKCLHPSANSPSDPHTEAEILCISGHIVRNNAPSTLCASLSRTRNDCKCKPFVINEDR